MNGFFELTYLHVIVKCESLFGGHGKAHRTVMAPQSTYEDFAEMGRGALVDYLELRGLSTSARKIELVALAYSAFVSNVPIIYTQEEISTNLKKEYAEKLKRHNIKKDSLSVTSDCLVDDVKK